MGHRQKMNDKQRLEWDVKQYKARLESMRGHYYPYWDDEKYTEWKEYKTTTSEELAKGYLNDAKVKFTKAKIVCGFEKTVQRIKHFTVIYKEK